MSVELGSEGTVATVLGIFDVRPPGQRRRFVVDEKAAVLDRRGLLHFHSVEGVNFSVALGRHICEPVPWRDTDLFGDIVDAVD